MIKKKIKESKRNILLDCSRFNATLSLEFMGIGKCPFNMIAFILSIVLRFPGFCNHVAKRTINIEINM